MRIGKFLQTVPMKLWLILAAAVLFSFFSNDFGLVDIQKTAIILAAGIDKTEAGFSVTTQIAVPKGSDRTTGGTSSVEIDAEGETVSDCISLIFSKTGWVPKLVFCNLIVLGEDAAKEEDAVAHLNYFLRNDYMPDSCLLAVCEGKAGELISSTSAIDDASSLAIGKLFSEAAVKSGKVLTNTLKDFAIDYYGVSKCSYLPYIRMTPQEGGQNDSQTAAGGSGGGSSSGGGQEEQQVYSAEETALFKEGKMVGLLPREQTLALSLLKGNVFTGTFNTEDGGKPVTLTVIKNDGGVSLDSAHAPKATLSLSVTVRLCCRGVTAPVEDIASDSVPEEILENAKATLEGYEEKLWELCKTSGCDVFQLTKMLYRSSLKKYSEWKDVLLETVTPAIETKVISMK